MHRKGGALGILGGVKLGCLNSIDVRWEVVALILRISKLPFE